MMKKILLLALTLIFYIGIYGQNADSIPPQAGFVFPLGIKVIIRLEPTDSVNFNYSVVKSENLTDVIDSYDDARYFSEKLDDNCIEFLFCVGTHGDTIEKKKANYQTLLILKNGTKYRLSYKADIQRSQIEKFESTSVVDLFSKVKSKEIWPYKIELIGLHDFKKK
jgi:hypothetical protein